MVDSSTEIARPIKSNMLPNIAIKIKRLPTLTTPEYPTKVDSEA